MRRKKKAPDARYKMAVVRLKETLEMSDIPTSSAQLNYLEIFSSLGEQFPFLYEESVLAVMSIS